MANEQPQNPTTPPTALLVRHRGFHLVWLIPLLAALAAGWLGWRSYANRGPLITIQFDNGAGLEAGKTLIRHKNVALGTVEAVAISDDLSKVIVTARMDKVAEPYLAQNAYFWVVKPSIASKNNAGLGTFISGAYIEFQPGRGPAERTFIGQQSPNFVPAEEPGVVYTLHAAQLGSISQGASLYFHGIKVGQVLGYDISEDDGVTIRLLVNAAYARLVHQATRFWNTSGITVSADSTGLKVQMESVESLLTGGIAFDVPPHTEPGPVAEAGTTFTLYPDESSARDSVYTKRLHFMLHFTQAVPGLAVNSPVRLQGVPIGQVTDVQINYDKPGHVVMPVIIEIEPERLKLNTDEAHYTDIFRALVQHGLRARLGMGNLLTGQKVIDLEMLPNQPPATLVENGSYPEIPVTDANDLDAILTSTKQLMGTLQTTANHLDNTVQDADGAISSDEGGGDLAGTIAEIKNTARSLRVITDYLQAHPESLLNGKPSEETP